MYQQSKYINIDIHVIVITVCYIYKTRSQATSCNLYLFLVSITLFKATLITKNVEPLQKRPPVLPF